MFKKSEELTEEETILLHGNCHKFVLDNYKQGDIIVVTVDYDYDIGKNCLMHSFILRGELYFDVRGFTSDLNNIFEAFDCGEYIDYLLTDLDKFKDLLTSLKIEI